MASFFFVKSKSYLDIRPFLEKGQTAVEYLLLLVVAIGMTITVMSKVKKWMLADSATCDGKKFSLICVVKGVFSANSTNNFQTFRVTK